MARTRTRSTARRSASVHARVAGPAAWVSDVLVTAGSGLLSWAPPGPPLGQALETLSPVSPLSRTDPGVPGPRSDRRAHGHGTLEVVPGTLPAMATPMPGFDPRAVIEGRPPGRPRTGLILGIIAAIGCGIVVL